ncbi:DnaB-like helicase N-terminal domain-containing protein [Streptomyces sp. NPDC001851]|uniref:DnaB-like helicase N-terminal domain-containing protein n=1 Tax=Streptomyces sp. NPDC001851 TaxID=3154529 RepID=UPI0033341029
MPHISDSNDDALDTVPPPQPVFYAEQALLGALLLEPWRLDFVTGIGPAAFSTASHAAVFAAIRSLPAPDPAEHAKNTKWLEAVLTGARERARGLTASYLHSLIQVCPWPRHAPAYARMIEAEHARRLLRATAQRLAQTARDSSLPHPVPSTLTEADALAAVVDTIAATFPPHSGALPRPSAPPPTNSQDDGAAVGEERLLLATAIAHPGDVEQMKWLTAGDFTLPLHAGLWQCLTALTRRHAPVDPITVLWEAQQRGLLDAATEPRQLLDVLAEPAGSPEHWGERILQRTLLTTAHHVGRLVEAFTTDSATTPYQLIVGSRRALADLSAVRARWHLATSPAPTAKPARARAKTAPRASPPRTRALPGARISR